MMMNDPKKRMASLIVAKLSARPKSEEENSPEMDGPSEHEVAAEEILKAVEAKDAAGLVEALKSFVEMCGESEPETEMETE